MAIFVSTFIIIPPPCYPPASGRRDAFCPSGRQSDVRPTALPNNRPTHRITESSTGSVVDLQPRTRSYQNIVLHRSITRATKRAIGVKSSRLDPRPRQIRRCLRCPAIDWGAVFAQQKSSPEIVCDYNRGSDRPLVVDITRPRGL
jgi:hypothetical protein